MQRICDRECRADVGEPTIPDVPPTGFADSLAAWRRLVGGVELAWP